MTTAPNLAADTSPLGQDSDISIETMAMGVSYPIPRFIRGVARRDNPKPGSGAIIQKGQQLYVEALRGLDLAVETGTRLGVLGANGAGKSTLLRILTGIYPPTTGSVRVSGRIGSMLDINTGFDQNETGRDNIFLRGIFMGMSQEIIEERMDGICSFSGLGDYLDMPLFSYSSGMRARLSFAIATGFEVDIIIMDEWLSAGDASFREQAQRHMNDYVEKAGIVVLASHSEGMLKRVCNRGIVLDSGNLVFDGPIDDSIEFHVSRNKQV
ncbi:MAG: ABC transporter ATP-binding protein [Ahrensia sp.]|nr:ABC transporter ATP-binding protein [Ahrensia sp.]